MADSPPLELLEHSTLDPEPDDPKPAIPRRALRRIASHHSGVVPDSVFQRQGNAVDLLDVLSQSHLLDTELVAAAGRMLYARLAEGAVGHALQDITAESRVLLDLRSPALDRLPWEIVRREELSLFLSTEQPWSRGSVEQPGIPHPLRAVDASPVLRMLIVVGSKRDDSAVQGDSELRAIEDELHRHTTRMMVQALVRPRAEEITRAFTEFRPHVFHFIGHGGALAGKPILRVFSDAHNQTENWDPDRLRAALQSGAVPRLVVMNACDTAKPRESWDLTGAFIRAGANAVVAMQAEIVGSAASLFSRCLFQRLAAGDPIDTAVTWARNQVATNGNQVDRPNWPVPRLVVRGAPDAVLPCPRRPPIPRPVVRAPEDFVGRFSQRKQAWDTLCPLRRRQPRLVVVEGPQQSGKTELLRILGEMWIRTWDHPAVYLDLGGPRTSDLRVLLEQMTTAVSAARLSPAPLQAIAADLQSDALCAAIRGALESCVPADKLLLLLLDGLEAWEPNVTAALVLRELSAPYATPDEQSRVRIAVAQPAALAGKVLWKDDYDVSPILVDSFPRADWIRAAPQFIRFHQSSLQGTQRQQQFERMAWPAAGMEEPDLLDTNHANMDTFPTSRLGIIRLQRKIVGPP